MWEPTQDVCSPHMLPCCIILASPLRLHRTTQPFQELQGIPRTHAHLLSKCRAANYKLDSDVLIFGNNYSAPKMLAYLLLVQKDDNEINVAQFPDVHQSLSQC